MQQQGDQVQEPPAEHNCHSAGCIAALVHESTTDAMPHLVMEPGGAQPKAGDVEGCSSAFSSMLPAQCDQPVLATGSTSHVQTKSTAVDAAFRTPAA